MDVFHGGGIQDLELAIAGEDASLSLGSVDTGFGEVQMARYVVYC